MRPLLIDAYCCQGGAGMGYWRAGFDIIGIDIKPQPRYPFPMIVGDALDVLGSIGHHADVIHASPPCQAYTNAQKIRGNNHPDLLAETRAVLQQLGLPYIIENVPGAPLVDPVELCGGMFNLGTYRHRLFESSHPITTPTHPSHVVKTTKMGRKPVPGEMMHVVGNFAGVTEAKTAMGIDWMSRDGLRESIPPAYTEYVGRQMMRQLVERAA